MSELSIPGLDVWPTEPLGDLCDIVIGRTPSRNRPEYWGGDFPWLSIADMNQGRWIQNTKEKITSAGVKESRSRLISKGTVLLSFKLSIGKVAVADIDTYTNEAIAALPIHDSDKLNRDYLFWCLRSIRLDEEVDIAAKGKTLNSKKLERLAIPLPPFDEQKRIAAVLDKADAIRHQRQKSLQLTEIFLQSVFIDMFGDPVANPKRWERVSFGDLLENIDSGWSPKCLDRPAREQEWGVLKLSSVTSCEYRWKENKGLPAYETPRIEHEVKIGDLLFTRKNTYELVAACALVRESPPKLLLPDLIFRFRLKPDSKMTPEYLHRLLITPSKRALIQQMAGGAAGSMPNISKAKLRELTIERPPLELQHQFTIRMGTIEKVLHSQRAMLIELEALFLSLQQRAFRGELDLSKIKLIPEESAPAEKAEKPAETVDGIFHRPGYFPTPPELEAEMMTLEDRLDYGPGDSIPWNENYFKYRILSQVLRAPYTFKQIWDQVRYDIEEPDYEAVKDKIFEYVEKGILRQRFCKKSKEIVFFPKRK